MLNRLRYKVSFKEPKQTFERDIRFEKGLTNICGKNGKGKSLNLEMIQYAMHGTSALRGVLSGYEVLDVRLEFSTHSGPYAVERSLNSVVLYDKDGKPIASGTKAVNAAVYNVFGYSPDVFRVANLSRQGEIEALGNMKPAERKALVDETLGLNMLEELETFISDQSKSVNATIRAMKELIIEPIAPTAPYDPMPSSETYSNSANALRDRIAERNHIQLEINKIGNPTEPVKVELEKDDSMLEFYMEVQHQRNGLLAQYQLVEKNYLAIPEGQGGDVQLEADDDRYQEYMAKVREFADLVTLKTRLENKLALLPVPEYTLEELQQYEAALNMVNRWVKKQSLLKNLHTYHCPKCNHEWHDHSTELSEYDDVPDERPFYPLTQQQLNEQFERHNNLPKRQELYDEITTIVFPLNHQADVERIEKSRKAYLAAEQQRQKAVYKAQMNGLASQIEAMQDHTSRIEAINKTREAVAEYKRDLAKFDDVLVKLLRLHSEIEKFPLDLDNQLVIANQMYEAIIRYETQLEEYATKKTQYDINMEALAKLQAESKDWENARKAVTDLRTKVKGYVLPSLNSVASALINEMTGGDLPWMVVNDKFEISVNGQPLETLSGAGKAVANLALRIALGRVLCSRVFNVLLLDEIDASCDDSRANYIADCLKRLTSQIDQIIQVSHKEGLVADHHIRME